MTLVSSSTTPEEETGQRFISAEGDITSPSTVPRTREMLRMLRWCGEKRGEDGQEGRTRGWCMAPWKGGRLRQIAIISSWGKNGWSDMGNTRCHARKYGIESTTKDQEECKWPVDEWIEEPWPWWTTACFLNLATYTRWSRFFLLQNFSISQDWTTIGQHQRKHWRFHMYPNQAPGNIQAIGINQNIALSRKVGH